MSESKKIAVLGGGSWATAIVKMLCNNVEQLHWWIRREETVDYINKYHINPNYLGSVKLDGNIVLPSTDINAVVDAADIIILAVPSAFLKGALENLTVDLKDKMVFSAIKGIVPQENMIVGDFLYEVYKLPIEQIGVITGPCHAEEVALERLSYLTVSSQNLEMAQLLADNLSCRYIKCNVSEDIYGTEYAAVLKNVVALAAGICHGVGYGDNFQAVLISNAIREIKRFVDKAHPIDRDINESAYLGDLLVTAYSQFSRNRTLGI